MVILFFPAGTARALTRTWDNGNANFLWDDEINWDGASPGNGIPGTNDAAAFAAAGVGTVDLGGEKRAVATLQAGAGGYTFTNGTLSLTALNPVNGGLTTVSAGVTDADGAGLLINQYSGGDSVGLIVSGQITVAGTNANALATGSPSSKNGQFTLGSLTLTNTVAGGVMLVTQMNGGTIFQGTWAIGGDLNLTRSSSQYLSGCRLNGPISIGGSLINSVPFNSGGVIEVNSPAVSVGGDLRVQPVREGQAPGIKLNQALTALGGDVKVYGATLWINVNDPIPSTTKAFLLGDPGPGIRDAAIEIGANGKTLRNPITVQSGSPSYNAILSSGAGGAGAANKVTYAGTIALGKKLNINAYNGDGCILDVTGIISGAQAVTVNSGGQAGTVLLSAANTFSGNTLIGGGLLQLGDNLAIQNSALDTSGAGLLAFSTGIDTPTFGGLIGANSLMMPANVTSLTLNPGAGATHVYAGSLRSITSHMALIKTGAGTQVLAGANTYALETFIRAGTLKLGAGGSIDNSCAISIAAGATFDVSDIAPACTLSTNLIAAGTGAAVGSSAAELRGPAGGTVSFASLSLLLSFTPASFNGDTAHPPLVLTQGALRLNGNPVTVRNTTGTRLGAGTYRLIQVNDGVIHVDAPPALIIAEDDLIDYAKASLAADGGNLDLVVVEDRRQPLVWATGNGLWDINTTASWASRSNAADVYLEGDAVVLDDSLSAGASVAITLNTSVTPRRVMVTNSAREYVISGTGGIGGTAGLAKSGANSLTLATANTYTGATAIHEGALVLAAGGSIDATPQISIAAGATFDVSAIEHYTLSTNTALSAGAGADAAATIRGSNTVDLGSQPLLLAFTPDGPGGDTNHPALLVTGASLALSNNVITVLNAGTAPLGPGVYRLIRVESGIISGEPFVVVSVGGTGLAAGACSYLTADQGGVDLVVQIANDQPIAWATGSGAWDIARTASWVDRTNGITRYFEADQVVFEDTLSGPSPITVVLNTTVHPSSVTVSSTKDFTIAGGGIGGATPLAKSGSGALTLSGTNSFYGGVTLVGGTLNLDSEQALGAASVVTLSGGALNINSPKVAGLGMLRISGSATLGSATGPKAVDASVDWLSGSPLNITESMDFGASAIYLGGTATARNLNIAAGRVLTIRGAVSGAGYMKVDCASSSGMLILSGTNTFSSAIDVRNGTLSVSSINSNGVAGPLGMSSLPVALGYNYNPAYATLRYTGAGEATDRGIKLDNNNDGAVLTLDHAGSGLLRFTSAFTFRQSKTRTLVLRNSGSGEGELAGALGESGTTALLKDGAGTWTLSATNTCRGPTMIGNGVLRLTATGSISNSPVVTIAAGAVLSVAGKPVYAMSGAQTNVFVINPAGAGSAGRIEAGALDITNGVVRLDIQGTPDDIVYVLATYTPPLTGAQFGSVTGVPAAYDIQYGFGGNRIALVRRIGTGGTLTVR